jgi:hypothetical protein
MMVGKKQLKRLKHFGIFTDAVRIPLDNEDSDSTKKITVNSIQLSAVTILFLVS